VVLLGRDEAYAVRALVIAAPVSSTIRGYAVEVGVGRREGLPRSSVINCDRLVTLSKERLLERIGALSAAKTRQLDDALCFALGLDSAR
jgi:mRNA interferase MazF